MVIVENRRKVSVFTNCCLVYWLTDNLILTGWQDINDIVFNDDEVDELPKGSGLRKRVAGMMVEVEADLKKKKSNGEDTTNSKVKDWVPPYIVAEFEDQCKQKNLVVVVVLPTGTCITTQKILTL